MSPAFKADFLPLSHQASPGFNQRLMANLTHQVRWWVRGCEGPAVGFKHARVSVSAVNTKGRR